MKAETETNLTALLESHAELLETVKVMRAHMVGLASYLATCAPGTIVGNLETTVATLFKQADKSEATLAKAKEITK